MKLPILPRVTTDDDEWVLDFSLTERRWDQGQHILVFKGQRNTQGEVPMAFRAPPFNMPLPGRIVGVTGSYGHWQRHPAAKACRRHYGYPPRTDGQDIDQRTDG